MTLIAPVGQVDSQTLQPIQLSGLTTTALPSLISSTPCGHEDAQLPQPVHFSVSITGLGMELTGSLLSELVKNFFNESQCSEYVL